MVHDPLREGLILELKMDEGTGTITLDSSGNRNHGVFGAGAAAPSWSTGNNGTPALSFDGDDDYVEISTSPSLDAMTELTLTIQLKTNDYTERQRLIEFFKATGDRLEFWLDNNLFNTYNHIDAAASNISSGWHPSDGIWCQLGLTIDISGNWKLWANGAMKVESAEGEKISDLDDGFKVVIGNWFSYNEATNGIIDEVRIYNRVLSLAEIRMLAGV